MESMATFQITDIMGGQEKESGDQQLEVGGGGNRAFQAL